MKDPNLIFTLEAFNENARQVCLDPCNLIRNPQPNDDGDVIFSSREPTPLHSPPQTQARLRFTLDKKPKDPRKGFTFGSDNRNCDVVIGKKRNGISGYHFCIIVDPEDRVILKDVSTKGTRVKYDGQGEILRTNFQWIIFPEYKKIIITVGESITEIRFEIKVPQHDPSDMAHRALLDSFLTKGQTALPISLMHIHSQETTAQPTGHEAPNRGHIYIKDELLGKGAFGKVHRVTDVSSGNRYAGKVFDRFLHEWKREIKILERLSHDYIVRFIEFTEEDQPMLVMEYLPMGNLDEQHKIAPMNDQDSVVLCYQLLQALEYMHSLNITHRDVKPQNILVMSREPFHAKLADFGFAKDGSTLDTYCGTHRYAAPEIHDRQRYTSAVDMWSVGVVVFDYAYGISDRFVNNFQGKAFCEGVVAAMNDCERDDLLEFLSKLLKVECRERLSASASLREIVRLNLIGDGSFESGKNTPAERDLVERVGSVSKTHNAEKLDQPRYPSVRVGEKRGVVPEQPLINVEQISKGSEQSTFIQDPLWQITEGSEILSQPAESDGMRKRLRSSKSLLGIQELRRHLQTKNAGAPLSSLSRLEELETTQILNTEVPLSPVAEGQQTRGPPLGFNEYVYRGQLFHECLYNDRVVRLRVGDKWICFTSMAEAAGQSVQWIFQILSTVNPESKESYHHKSLGKKGILVELSLASIYAKQLGVFEQMQRLLATNTNENMIFSARGYESWVLPSRNKVNAAQLIAAAGFKRGQIGRALQSLNITSWEYNGKPSKCAMGTYIDFQDGLKLCQHFGLEQEPVVCFMNESVGRRYRDTAPKLRQSKSRLIRRKETNEERSPDRKESDQRNEQEHVEDRQDNVGIEADLDNEEIGEQNGKEELWDKQTEDQIEGDPLASSTSRLQQTSPPLSTSSVLKWHLGTSQLDRLSPHHNASGRNSFHRLDDSLDDLEALFHGVSETIAG